MRPFTHGPPACLRCERNGIAFAPLNFAAYTLRLAQHSLARNQSVPPPLPSVSHCAHAHVDGAPSALGYAIALRDGPLRSSFSCSSASERHGGEGEGGVGKMRVKPGRARALPVAVTRACDDGNECTYAPLFSHSSLSDGEKRHRHNKAFGCVACCLTAPFVFFFISFFAGRCSGPR